MAPSRRAALYSRTPSAEKTHWVTPPVWPRSSVMSPLEDSVYSPMVPAREPTAKSCGASGAKAKHEMSPRSPSRARRVEHVGRIVHSRPGRDTSKTRMARSKPA